MPKIEKNQDAIQVKMVKPASGKANRMYQYETDTFQRLGREIKVSPKANATISKNGFKLEIYMPTVNVVVGIGNNHVADLVMDVAAWEALLDGEEINITTTEEFKNKYVYTPKKKLKISTKIKKINLKTSKRKTTVTRKAVRKALNK